MILKSTTQDASIPVQNTHYCQFSWPSDLPLSILDLTLQSALTENPASRCLNRILQMTYPALSLSPEHYPQVAQWSMASKLCALCLSASHNAPRTTTTPLTIPALLRRCVTIFLALAANSMTVDQHRVTFSVPERMCSKALLDPKIPTDALSLARICALFVCCLRSHA